MRNLRVSEALPANRLRAVLRVTGMLVVGAMLGILPVRAQELGNDTLSVKVDAKGASYQVARRGERAILTSRVAARINGEWVRCSDYPRHEAVESAFSDALGSARQITLTCSGKKDEPDLVLVVQLYEKRPYGAVTVKVRNTGTKEVTVQAIRSVEATGNPVINLGGAASAERVLSDSFSEDWPDMKICDLGKTAGGLHRGVGSQLIYNRESKQSLFLGALSSEKFLTILRLQSEGSGEQTKVASYTVDSTGTTEIQKAFDLENAAADAQVELSLPVKPGETLASERLLFTAGPDYHAELLAYGEAIRLLHHPRLPKATPIGWWSWTAFYAAINEGETLANADWQAQHLKELGYQFFQIDEGYQYARGEFTTANAAQFPNGLRYVGHRITGDGLTLGIWTAPFEVTSRAWVYEKHKEWLVHDAKGNPIPLGDVWGQKIDTLYALDTTHPGAQEYLRQTYKTLVREWGVRFIKLDFMDTTAIEGYHHRPHTTALQAQRIGLQIIRDTVGDDVILDKDGSPMLNTVGLTETGRVSTDTGHSFERTKTAGTGIAARFYMDGNFFVNDPDAFNTTSEGFDDRWKLPGTLPLAAAQASIALAAVAGGMYEIGDDMTVLGREKDRLALVENKELLRMAKWGHASTPVDLLSYEPEDEQPSVFLLQEGPRQAILTVFNWTKNPRSHTLRLADLGLPAEHAFSATDVLNPGASLTIGNGSVQIADEPAESVRVIKLIDGSVPETAPLIRVNAPASAKAGETFSVSGDTDAGSVPVVAYSWNFGDGISAQGRSVNHAYTHAGDFKIVLKAESVDGGESQKSFPVKVTGSLKALPQLRDNKRFREPTEH
ncbi:MAG: PKD domain-containing protein [Candidatus Acidiferrales bacterium]